jgi:hypothetical protein
MGPKEWELFPIESRETEPERLMEYERTASLTG